MEEACADVRIIAPFAHYDIPVIGQVHRPSDVCHSASHISRLKARGSSARGALHAQHLDPALEWRGVAWLTERGLGMRAAQVLSVCAWA